MIRNNKKAAMFGLDARIALAIFGALSVITGAAMYSAIKNAKAAALLNDFNEIGKAWEAYYLDTGKSLPKLSENNKIGDFYVLQTKFFVISSGSKNWRGPYINYQINGDYIRNSKYESVILETLVDDVNWGRHQEWIPNGTCTSGKRCFLWVMINGFDDDSLALRLDQIVDGGDGSTTGDFRWGDTGIVPADYEYYLKYAPIKNPND